MCRLVSLMSMHAFESPTCLGNHEAKARALLAEEKYKELQVGQCVECWSSVELCQFMSDHSWTRAHRHILDTTWTELDYTLDASVNVAASHLLSKRRISSKVSQSFSKRKKCSRSKFERHITRLWKCAWHLHLDTMRWKPWAGRSIAKNNVPWRCCKSFNTKAQELVQQTTAENAEKQVELEEAGAFMFAFFHLELRKLMAWSCVGWWVSWVCILSNPQLVLEIMRQRLEHSSLKKQGCWLKRSTRNCRWVSVSNADRALNFVSSCQIILAQEHADISWIQLGQNLTTPWMQVWMWLLRIFWAKGGSPAKSANPSPRERNAPAASSRGT